MRLLHTGDWHVGRTVRGGSRMGEFEAVLDEVVGIATGEGVDAVLVAGDLYDQRAITADADRLIFATLIRLWEKGIPVVALPGNHDSAARFEAFAPLLTHIGASFVAKVRPPDAGGVVTVPARDGSHSARISCVPFVSPRRFSDATGLFEDLAAGYVDFDAGMRDLLAEYEKAFEPNAVNVVMGHLFVAGAVPGGGERPVTIGADYATSPGHLPRTAGYIALGHIHKPQAVKAAAAPARYCGSLLQLDFGERGQDKSVVIVDAKPGSRAKVRTVPITNGRKMLDVAGTIDELPGLVESVGDSYLRVTVKVEAPVPGIADRVREILPNALDVTLDHERTELGASEVPLRSLQPRDQFISYYRESHAADPGEELVEAFDRVYEDVTT